MLTRVILLSVVLSVSLAQQHPRFKYVEAGQRHHEDDRYLPYTTYSESDADDAELNRAESAASFGRGVGGFGVGGGYGGGGGYGQGFSALRGGDLQQGGGFQQGAGFQQGVGFHGGARNVRGGGAGVGGGFGGYHGARGTYGLAHLAGGDGRHFAGAAFAAGGQRAGGFGRGAYYR